MHSDAADWSVHPNALTILTSSHPMTSNLEFDSIVRQVRPQLVRFMSRIVGDADSEDVVQLVLAKAHSALFDFRGDASPRTWLFRIATNAAHDWNRARGARTVEPIDETDECLLTSTVADAPSEERRLVREQMGQCVREILARLPESYQTVLALSDCEELSDREVAEVLGVTVGSAKIRLHRARTRLKQELEATCTFYHDAENTLCCDKKQESTESAYRSELEVRHQCGSQLTGDRQKNRHEEPAMTMTETLSPKQKHLIGVGAAIAAGCHPCTSSFASAAREQGACGRGVRLALEVGLSVREEANTACEQFANTTFERPEIDAALRAERAQLSALVGLAAAVASNAATSLPARIEAARATGATDDQIRTAVQIARTAKRGAEVQTEAALQSALGQSAQPNESTLRSDAQTSCCEATAHSSVDADSRSPCGCVARP